MEFIRGAYNLRSCHHGCVVTVGNFDGVHVGHQKIIERLIVEAKRRQLPSCVMTFEPHPYEFFGDNIKPRLTKLRGKLVEFKKLGVDRVLCLRFDQQLAQVSADQFIEQILVKKLGAQFILVGDDFRFGHKRQGDIDLLKQRAPQLGFEVEAVATISHGDGLRISSTSVRAALEQDDLERAGRLLGRPYSMSGKVAHGDQRGRMIGFPTANIFLHRAAVPIHGVYCVRVYGLDGSPINGVANVGNRPTVGGTKSLLEVHLFDFDRDIYGKHINVECVKKLRDEAKFDSFDQLKEQIMIDAEQARAFFKSLSIK